MGQLTKEMIEAALKAYAAKRNPQRWDGEPWGEAGIHNHREAIKAAIRAANEVGSKKSDKSEVDDMEMQERIRFKMEELLTAVRNTSSHLWSHSAYTGNPKYLHKKEAFDHFAKMLRKEMNMQPPHDNMSEVRFIKHRNKAVDDIVERFQILGRRDSRNKEIFLLSVIQKAMNWCR